VVSTVARSPLAILALITGTMVLGPWRIVKWVSQGAVLFNLAKRVQHFVGK
jgi:hypothetical protein